MSAIVVLLSVIAASPFEAKLISVQENKNPAEQTFSSEQITPDCPTPWSVTKTRLYGGKQQDVDIVTIDNGRLKIVVVPTRGMGIWEVVAGEQRIGWDSPVNEIVHPQFVNLTARGGLGWLDGFGEFMCRCGLESNGHPGKDTIVDNTGAEASMDLTLHGKLANLPAQEVELIVEKEAPYRIQLRGRVEEHMMHGPKLSLTTAISTEPGASTFTIADDIRNDGGTEAEFEILYHTNFGPPVLEEGSSFVAPMKKVTPFNDRAAEGDVREFAVYAGPEPGFVEQVYCVEPYEDEDGMTTIALANRSKSLATTMRYSVEALPYITVWKNTAAVEDGYVTGIEPGTNYPYNRSLERKAGRVPKLKPGETRHIEIEFGIHDGLDEVIEALGDILLIQGDRQTEFVDQPEIPE